MISDLALLDNPKVRVLAQAIYDQIEDVIEVRFHPVLRHDMKRIAGEKSLVYSAIIEEANGKFTKFYVTVPMSVWDSEDSHQLIVDQMAGKILAYQQTGVYPSERTIPQSIIPGE